VSLAWTASSWCTPRTWRRARRGPCPTPRRCWRSWPPTRCCGPSSCWPRAASPPCCRAAASAACPTTACWPSGTAASRVTLRCCCATTQVGAGREGLVWVG
jgi:hypothetical protein